MCNARVKTWLFICRTWKFNFIFHFCKINNIDLNGIIYRVHLSKKRDSIVGAGIYGPHLLPWITLVRISPASNLFNKGHPTVKYRKQAYSHCICGYVPRYLSIASGVELFMIFCFHYNILVDPLFHLYFCCSGIPRSDSAVLL